MLVRTEIARELERVRFEVLAMGHVLGREDLTREPNHPARFAGTPPWQGGEGFFNVPQTVLGVEKIYPVPNVADCEDPCFPPLPLRERAGVRGNSPVCGRRPGVYHPRGPRSRTISRAP